MRMHCFLAVASIWLQLTSIKLNTFTVRYNEIKLEKDVDNDAANAEQVAERKKQ